MQIEVKDKYTGKNIKEPNSEIPDPPKPKPEPEPTKRRRKIPFGFILTVAAAIGVVGGLIFAIIFFATRSDIVGVWILQDDKQVVEDAENSDSEEQTTEEEATEETEDSSSSFSKLFHSENGSITKDTQLDSNIVNWQYEFREDGTGTHGLGFGTPRTFHYKTKDGRIIFTYDKKGNTEEREYRLEGDKLIIKNQFGQYETYERKK